MRARATREGKGLVTMEADGRGTAVGIRCIMQGPADVDGLHELLEYMNRWQERRSLSPGDRDERPDLEFYLGRHGGVVLQLGDQVFKFKSAREARLIAYGLLHQAEELEPLGEPAFEAGLGI